MLPLPALLAFLLLSQVLAADLEVLPDGSSTFPPALSVPTIDLAPLFVGSRDPSYAPTLDAMIHAARTLGFFHVTNHGVSAGLARRNLEAQKEFFALPPGEKAALGRTRENSRGWSATELTKNVRDAKELFDFGHSVCPAGAGNASSPAGCDPGFGRNQFPRGLGRRGSLLEPPTVPLMYFTAAVDLSHKLLNLLLAPLNVTLPPDDGK
jgi:isopenicillin N synthase-like dioxygenase